jgi:hypothetical protein
MGNIAIQTYPRKMNGTSPASRKRRIMTPHIEAIRIEYDTRCHHLHEPNGLRREGLYRRVICPPPSRAFDIVPLIHAHSNFGGSIRRVGSPERKDMHVFERCTLDMEVLLRSDHYIPHEWGTIPNPGNTRRAPVNRELAYQDCG